ncbi:hypothetical protein BCU75_14410 [Vibrio splendidus]|nr:hypothetical protein BCU75_14410 [Vibrio splendidus]
MRGAAEHLVVNGLKVYGKGTVKKQGADGNRRVRRKLHFAVDASTHETIVTELSLSTVTDGEVLLNLLKQIHRNPKYLVMPFITQELVTQLLRLSKPLCILRQ